MTSLESTSQEGTTTPRGSRARTGWRRAAAPVTRACGGPAAAGKPRSGTRRLGRACVREGPQDRRASVDPARVPGTGRGPDVGVNGALSLAAGRGGEHGKRGAGLEGTVWPAAAGGERERAGRTVHRGARASDANATGGPEPTTSEQEPGQAAREESEKPRERQGDGAGPPSAQGRNRTHKRSEPMGRARSGHDTASCSAAVGALRTRGNSPGPGRPTGPGTAPHASGRRRAWTRQSRFSQRVRVSDKMDHPGAPWAGVCLGSGHGLGVL